MKKIVLLTIALCFIFIVPVIAQELPEGLTGVDGGAYVIAKDKKGLEVAFVFNTFTNMTKDKSSDYDSKDARTTAYLTKEAKELADRLLKIDDVSMVFISYRRVQVFKFPLVPNFDGMKDDIIEAFETVFD